MRCPSSTPLASLASRAPYTNIKPQRRHALGRYVVHLNTSTKRFLAAPFCGAHVALRTARLGRAQTDSVCLPKLYPRRAERLAYFLDCTVLAVYVVACVQA